MNCIYCQRREATVNDIFCHPCADELGQEGMQKMKSTLIGQGMLAHKAWRELVQVIKRELLKSLHRT